MNKLLVFIDAQEHSLIITKQWIGIGLDGGGGASLSTGPVSAQLDFGYTVRAPCMPTCALELNTPRIMTNAS